MTTDTEQQEQHELQERQIPGNGGHVRWTWNPERAEHVVSVYAHDGYLAGSVATTDPDQARTFFDHPFATKTVEDIFSRRTEANMPGGYTPDHHDDGTPKEDN